MGKLLNEIDRGRRYEGGSIVAAILDWVSGEGFAETFSRHGVDQFPSAHAYRERHIIGLMRDLRGLLGGS